MSYNNNWVKTLTESYINNRPTNLDEQLQEQVALNEELLGLIEALCEELGIDMEELFEENKDPIGRFSSASAGHEDIKKEIEEIKQKMSSGSQEERDPSTDKFDKLERRLKELKQKLAGK